MKNLQCSHCGATGLIERGGRLICEYCDSVFAPEAKDMPQKSMGMSLNADIDRLLQKCRSDPRNAGKYANLILDLDPTNSEALKYL